MLHHCCKNSAWRASLFVLAEGMRSGNKGVWELLLRKSVDHLAQLNSSSCFCQYQVRLRGPSIQENAGASGKQSRSASWNADDRHCAMTSEAGRQRHFSAVISHSPCSFTSPHSLRRSAQTLSSMSPPNGPAPNASAAATEHSPLLEGGTNGNSEQPPSNGDVDSIPLAEEPSTAKLVLTLASVWVGVFLAALGRFAFNNTQESSAVAANGA